MKNNFLCTHKNFDLRGKKKSNLSAALAVTSLLKPSLFKVRR